MRKNIVTCQNSNANSIETRFRALKTLWHNVNGVVVGKISSLRERLRETGDGEMQLKNKMIYSLRPRWFLNYTTMTARDNQTQFSSNQEIESRGGLQVGQ